MCGGNEDLFLLVKSHIAVHHGTDADGCKLLYLRVILLADISAEVFVAILKTAPDVLDAVGPQSVDQLIVPRVVALRDGFVVRVDQNGLDSGRSKLDSEYRLACFDDCFGFCFHVDRCYK